MVMAATRKNEKRLNPEIAGPRQKKPQFLDLAAPVKMVAEKQGNLFV